MAMHTDVKLNPVAFMSRHFVALTCDYETIKPDGSVETKGTQVYSGFLLEVHDVFFWVTAGHCLKDELDSGIESGKLRITGGAFMDCFGHEAKHLAPIPFRYEIGCGFYVERPELGLDFGLITLNSLHVQAFAANKLVAVSRKNWVHQPKLTFDFYRMLGIPKHRVFTVERPDGTLDTKAQQAMLAINRIGVDEVGEVPPEARARPLEEWFIGRLDPECDILSLAGMSGGPIFGFRRNETGQLTYHVVALQSRWWPKSRTIFGCSLPMFAEEVHRMLGDYIDEQSREPD